MKQTAYIHHQISNEPFSNILLILGLTIATVIIWFIVDFMFVTYETAHEPMGLDIDRCYNLQLGNIPKASPDYDRQHSNTPRQVAADIAHILAQLKKRKEVEAVCISQNASPYSYQNANIIINYNGKRTDSLDVIYRQVSPEYMQVFHYTDTKNGSYRPLEEALRRNEILLSRNLTDYFHQRPEVMTGRYVTSGGGQSYKIGGVFKTVKYDEYTEAYNNYQVVVLLPNSAYETWNELSVRLKPGREKAFIVHLHQTDYRTGNIYISRVSSYKELRRNYLNSYNDYFTPYRVGFVFILVNVFLGLYGTFSYRTWQRREETGLMKVLGATNTDIASRLFSEALFLLSIATGIAVIIALDLTYLKINRSYEGHYLDGGRFILTFIITYIIMALTILASILLPVLKALHIKPINVLKHD